MEIDVKNLTQEEQSKLVETVVCKRLDGMQMYPLTDQQANVLMNCLLSRDKGGFVNSSKGLVKVVNEDAMFRMIKNRLEIYGIKVDNDFLLMCYYLFERPGEVSLMAAYIAYRVKYFIYRTSLNIDDFCKIFAGGYFRTEDINTVWDSQKVDPSQFGGSVDNIVDYKTFNKSIMSTK